MVGDAIEPTGPPSECIPNRTCLDRTRCYRISKAPLSLVAKFVNVHTKLSWPVDDQSVENTGSRGLATGADMRTSPGPSRRTRNPSRSVVTSYPRYWFSLTPTRSFQAVRGYVPGFS